MNTNIFLESYSAVDLKLLSLLQKDAVLSTAELAKKTGLSPNSVRKKYNGFKADGVIAREVAVLNPEKVGSFLYFMADLKLAGSRPGAVEAVKTFAVDSPWVLQCFQTTGSWDFKLLIAARTLSEFEKFCHSAFVENRDVDHYESNLVIRPVKVGFTLPLL